MIRNFYDFRHTFSVRRRFLRFPFFWYPYIFFSLLLLDDLVYDAKEHQANERTNLLQPRILQKKKDNDKRLQNWNKLIECEMCIDYYDCNRNESRNKVFLQIKKENWWNSLYWCQTINLQTFPFCGEYCVLRNIYLFLITQMKMQHFLSITKF